jgi:putative transposase
MTCQEAGSQFDLAMELLITNVFGNVADVVGILMNSAMQIERPGHLQAIPYERTEERRGYANGFKPKTLKTRFGRSNCLFHRREIAVSIHRVLSVVNDQNGP